jgi:uncharacterized protein (TIGR00369 family)
MESVGGGDESNRIGVLPPDIISQYSGLEVLKRMMNGELPLPAMSEIIPFRLTEVASGRAVFESTPDEKFYNTAGFVHGGYAMTLLDTCMAIAAYSTLAPAIRYSTIETKVNFTRPITAATGILKAIGTAVHTGKKTGTAEGRLVDSAGALYAHGTTTIILIPEEAKDSRTQEA